MKSNNIKIRFWSESHFEKFPFNSETITYNEILLYLERKKKIDIQKKTDNIQLLNCDQNNEEILPEQKIIHAGSRIIVRRKPEQPAKTETLELTYNPKQTMDRTRAVLDRVNNRKDMEMQDNEED